MSFLLEKGLQRIGFLFLPWNRKIPPGGSNSDDRIWKRTLRTKEILEMLGFDHRKRLFFSSNNRPYLNNQDCLDFNISNQRGAALIGFSEQRKIGIDLERLEERRLPDGIMSQYFTEGEKSRIVNMPTWEKRVAMAQTWVSKEAIAKCLDQPLDFSKIEVPLLEGKEERNGLEVEVQSRRKSVYLHKLKLPEGWIGALALSN